MHLHFVGAFLLIILSLDIRSKIKALIIKQTIYDIVLYNKRRSGKMVWRYRCVGNFLKYGLDDEPNIIGYQEIYDIVKSKLKELMKSLKLNSDEFINSIVNKVDTDEHIKVLVSEKNKIVTRLNTIDQSSLDYMKI